VLLSCFLIEILVEIAKCCEFCLVLELVILFAFFFLFVGAYVKVNFNWFGKFDFDLVRWCF